MQKTDTDLLNNKVITEEFNFNNKIKNILPKNTLIEYQYNIGKYIVDIYLPDYNLVIEFDKYENKDNGREKYIKDKIKCNIVKLKLNEKDFNFYSIVPEIYKNMGFKEINNKKVKVNIEHKEDVKNDKENIIKKEKPKTKKSNSCIDCDTEIYQGNQRCTFCMNKKKFQDSCKNTDRPSKEQLLKDIEELGYTGSGKKYGVSDNCVRKWIKGYNKFNL